MKPRYIKDHKAYNSLNHLCFVSLALFMECDVTDNQSDCLSGCPCRRVVNLIVALNVQVSKSQLKINNLHQGRIEPSDFGLTFIGSWEHCEKNKIKIYFKHFSSLGSSSKQ